MKGTKSQCTKVSNADDLHHKNRSAQINTILIKMQSQNKAFRWFTYKHVKKEHAISNLKPFSAWVRSTHPSLIFLDPYDFLYLQYYLLFLEFLYFLHGIFFSFFKFIHIISLHSFLSSPFFIFLLYFIYFPYFHYIQYLVNRF